MSKTTKHAPTCKKAFARKDPTCPRCQELLAGAAPVVWASTERKAEERANIAAIRAHKCTKACGPCCVRFDY